MLANVPCAICGGSTRLLICDECLPAEKVRQSATVRVGDERNPITMRLRAGDRAAGTQLDVTMRIEWNHDRGREERKVIVIDQRSGRYWQRWYSLETGEVTWEKEGSRTDQSIHGPESHRPGTAPDQ
ncbi:hypothetical protein GCM10009641_82240 [Mycobacterium cookii]|uniref:hypothetical protein n=1 Tax=Nocardioides furvisabuli TaxID=375542 RepID=UPI001E4D6D3D|nr:hypothetical protein [Nocardioides furvisabuli]